MDTTTRAGRRPALWVSLLAALGLTLALAVPQIVSPLAAHASIAPGTIVFEQLQTGGNYAATIQMRAPNGTLTNLSTGSPGYPSEDHQPSVSPDGTKIAFIGSRPDTDNSSYETLVLMVMNADGSGQTELVIPTTTGEQDSAPVWSPDGTKIAFGSQSGNYHYISVINANGSGETTLSTGGYEFNPSWSPTKTSGHYMITYERDSGVGGNGQLWIINDDGTNEHAISSTDTGYNDMAPTWSGAGGRIYFTSGEGNGLWYYSSTNGFTSGTATRSASTVNGTNGQGDPGENLESYVRSSTDGSTLVYAARDSSNHEELWSMCSTGTNVAQLTTNGATYSNWAPTYAASVTCPDAPAPTWWNSTTCDTAHNSGSHTLTHSGVTTSYRGIIACGGGSTVYTTFGITGGHQEIEWQCVELVMRYMYLIYGIAPYAANGYQVVSNYSGSVMTKVSNDGTHVPVVGDVMAYAISPNHPTNGHTAIVTAVNVTSGTGTVSVIEQNNSTTGVNSVAVSGNKVQDGVTGWLHYNQ